jgi:hypothetical protein
LTTLSFFAEDFDHRRSFRNLLSFNIYAGSVSKAAIVDLSGASTSRYHQFLHRSP